MGHQYLQQFWRHDDLPEWMVAGLVLLAFGSLVGPCVWLKNRTAAADEQVGIKVLFHFFLSVGYFLLLIGLSLLAMEVWNDGLNIEPFSHNTRTGLALVCAGLLISLLHRYLLRKGTNDREWPQVRRTYVGLRLALHGFVVCFCLTALALLLVQRDPRSWYERAEVRRQQVNYYAVLTTWGASWLLHLGLYWRAQPALQKAKPSWEDKE